jgi:hypothetical protein
MRARVGMAKLEMAEAGKDEAVMAGFEPENQARS